MAYQRGGSAYRIPRLSSDSVWRACFTQQWVNCAPVFLHHHQRLGMRAKRNLKKSLACGGGKSQAPPRMKDNTQQEIKREVAVVLPLEMVDFLYDQMNDAASIIEGFLSRFEEPSCREQQEVVDRANVWVADFRLGEKLAKQKVAMMKVENN